jgi:hypothetical protein
MMTPFEKIRAAIAVCLQKAVSDKYDRLAKQTAMALGASPDESDRDTWDMLSDRLLEHGLAPHCVNTLRENLTMFLEPEQLVAPHVTVVRCPCDTNEGPAILL